MAGQKVPPESFLGPHAKGPGSRSRPLAPTGLGPHHGARLRSIRARNHGADDDTCKGDERQQDHRLGRAEHHGRRAQDDAGGRGQGRHALRAAEAHLQGARAQGREDARVVRRWRGSRDPSREGTRAGRRRARARPDGDATPVHPGDQRGELSGESLRRVRGSRRGSRRDGRHGRVRGHGPVRWHGRHGRHGRHARPAADAAADGRQPAGHAGAHELASHPQLHRLHRGEPGIGQSDDGVEPADARDHGP